jgi:hypothetical protein
MQDSAQARSKEASRAFYEHIWSCNNCYARHGNYCDDGKPLYNEFQETGIAVSLLIKPELVIKRKFK